MRFDAQDHFDGLRVRETCWLLARRAEVVAEQRRLRVEELAIVAVLDERGTYDEVIAAADGVSARVARETLETARALEALPAIAAAAHDGALSEEQLGAVVQLADESSDAEWARRAPNTAPADLQKQVRTQSKPTAADSRARHEARGLRMWWDQPRSMLHLRGQLPDLAGALFESTINEIVKTLRPAPGEPWDSRDHRAADALVGLCAHGSNNGAERVDADDSSEHRPALAPKPVLVVDVPLQGSATVAGVPLPDALVEQLRASASIEPHLVDEHGIPTVIGRRVPGSSPKIVRAVLLRDGHCRWPGCDHRHGLEVHHLVPRSWSGTDDIANLVTVCARHHRRLVPHGVLALVGNPNHPDGIHLVDHCALSNDEARHYGLPPPHDRRE